MSSPDSTTTASPTRALVAQLLEGEELYRAVVRERLMQARESVWVSTANVKAMMVERGPDDYVPIVEVFNALAKKGVEVRLLHAELPSRPFRQAFDARTLLVRGGMQLKICPRVHFKCVLIDGAWLYLGSANLTGAGLGAKHADSRNFELGFVTEDFDAIDRVTALYQQVWEGISCRTCRLYDVCPDPIGAGPQKKKKRRAAGRSSGSNVVLGRARRLSR